MSEYKTQRDAIISSLTLTGLTTYKRPLTDNVTFPLFNILQAGTEEMQQGYKSYTTAYKYAVAVCYQLSFTGNPTDTDYDTAIENAYSKLESLLEQLKANATFGNRVQYDEISIDINQLLGKTIAAAYTTIKVLDRPVNSLK